MKKELAGIVKSYNTKKGYGFIGAENGEDVFVHHSSIVGEGFKALQTDQKVLFEIEQGQRGPVAVNVKRA